MALSPEPEPLNDADRKLLELVHQHGHQVTHVSPSADAPGWSYSIGIFRTHAQPEVVVFGLDQTVAHSVVNEFGRRARVQDLEADQVHDGLLEGHSCVLKPVQRRWYASFFGWGLWYYCHQPFPVLQLVWPDRSHLFPWDRLFYEPWRPRQPLLYEAEPGPANVEALLRSMVEH